MDGRMREVMNKYSEERMAQAIYEVAMIVSEQSPGILTILDKLGYSKNKSIPDTDSQIYIMRRGRDMKHYKIGDDEYQQRLVEAMYKVRTWNNMCMMSDPNSKTVTQINICTDEVDTDSR